jgi:hypothetical protein
MIPSLFLVFGASSLAFTTYDLAILAAPIGVPFGVLLYLSAVLQQTNIWSPLTAGAILTGAVILISEHLLFTPWRLDHE